VDVKEAADGLDLPPVSGYVPARYCSWKPQVLLSGADAGAICTFALQEDGSAHTAICSGRMDRRRGEFRVQKAVQFESARW
jgi:hypothetical protein